MNIEFYCKHCYQKVITPEETAGKQGRCPHCEELNRIPIESEPERETAGYVKLDETVVQSAKKTPSNSRVRIGDPGWRETFQMSKWGEFSHEKKHRIREQQREWASRTMSAPATGLLIAAALGMVAVIIYVVLLVLAFAQMAAVSALDDGFNGTGLAVHILLIVANIVVNTLIVVGANHMRMARSYTMAMAGAILALMPLPLNFLCVVSYPFAFWALFQLVRADIRESFRNI